MQVCRMETLQAMPTLGALVGTVASASTINNFNAQFGGDQAVLFGQTGDPLKERYLNLQAVFNNVIVPTQERVIMLEAKAEEPVYKAVESEYDLRHVSDNMKLPILMHEPVRELFKEDRIYGYGFDKRNLPEEDVYGRLLDNNSANFNSKEDIPEWMYATHLSSDPEIPLEALDAIAETRKFVDEWLANQMGPEGSMLDPTDLDNSIKRK